MSRINNNILINCFFYDQHNNWLSCLENVVSNIIIKNELDEVYYKLRLYENRVDGEKKQQTYVMDGGIKLGGKGPT